MKEADDWVKLFAKHIEEPMNLMVMQNIGSDIGLLMKMVAEDDLEGVIRGLEGLPRAC